MASSQEFSLPREALQSLPSFQEPVTNQRNVTAQLIATKKTDAKIKAAILIVLAVIIGGCGAYLIATSGGPTNALLLYGGIGLSVGAVAFLLVLAVVAEKARRFNNLKKAELVDFLQHAQNNAAIYLAMTEGAIQLENLSAVLRGMSDGHYKQFVEYAAGEFFSDRTNNPVSNNEETLLAALAYEPRFTVTPPLVELGHQAQILNTLPTQEAAIQVVSRLSDLRYDQLVRSELTDQTRKAVIADERFLGLTSDLQRRVLKKASNDDVNAVVGRLSVGKYVNLATLVLTLKTPNQFVLDALSSSVHASQLTVIQLRDLMKRVDQEKANAIVSRLAVVKYMELFESVSDFKDQVVLNALASSVHISELTYPQLQGVLMEHVDQETANLAIRLLNQKSYGFFLENALKESNNDKINEALAVSDFVLTSSQTQQRELLERLSEEKAQALVGRLNEEQYVALVEHVTGVYFASIEPIAQNALVLQALGTSNHTSALNIDELVKLIGSLTQEKVVAVFSQLNNQRFSDSVAYIYQTYHQPNEKVKFAIAQRPKDFGGLVNIAHLSVNAIREIYALMNEVQKAEFIKEVTDRFGATNAIEHQEERGKINKIVEDCIQETIDEFARESLVTQFARWPEHSGKQIATRDLWKNGALLDAYWKKMNEEQQASFAKGAGDVLAQKNEKEKAQHWINMIEHYGDEIPLFILKTMHATNDDGLKDKIKRVMNQRSPSERNAVLKQKHIKEALQKIVDK